MSVKDSQDFQLSIEKVNFYEANLLRSLQGTKWPEICWPPRPFSSQIILMIICKESPQTALAIF